MPAVSSDIDTFLRSANNAAARTSLGCAGLSANTFTGALTLPSGVGLLPAGSGTTDLGQYNLGFGTLRFRTIAAESGSGINAFSATQDEGIKMGQSAQIGWCNGAAGVGNNDTFCVRGGIATIQQGSSSATPVAQTYKGPNGSGTNIVGGKLCLAPGQSTGNATPAVLALQGTAAGSSGTTAQTLVDVLSIIRAGVIRITGIPTSSAGLSTGDVYSNAGILTIV